MDLNENNLFLNEFDHTFDNIMQEFNEYENNLAALFAGHINLDIAKDHLKILQDKLREFFQEFKFKNYESKASSDLLSEKLAKYRNIIKLFTTASTITNHLNKFK